MRRTPTAPGELPKFWPGKCTAAASLSVSTKASQRICTRFYQGAGFISSGRSEAEPARRNSFTRPCFSARGASLRGLEYPSLAAAPLAWRRIKLAAGFDRLRHPRKARAIARVAPDLNFIRAGPDLPIAGFHSGITFKCTGVGHRKGSKSPVALCQAIAI